MKYLLLSFDIEEFDLPFEFNIRIDKEKMFKISYDGTLRILKILEKNKIKVTFFVTAVFAKKYPKLIKKISKEHEIALHGYEHKDNYNFMDEEEVYKRLKKAKEILEKISGKKITGFRAPKLNPPKYEILKKIGMKYDSSLNPICIPGRYNNFFKSRKPFVKDGIKVIPLSATPICRLPLFWVCFRNFGLGYDKICTKLCLLDQNFVSLVFHPWEFMDLKNLNLPKLIKRNTGNKMEIMLDSYLKFCNRIGLKSINMKDYCSARLG